MTTTDEHTDQRGALADTLDQGLGQLFGFDEFRDGQRPAMDAIVAGRDALIVMPTGSGKSLCYQLTACVKRGVTVVISPLIALMKDQVDSLQQLGLPATEINSSMSWEEQQRRIQALRDGQYKLVYVAPERFRSGSFRQALSRVDVSMLAVDEAHCVSQWGHDFRPDYLRIADIRRDLGRPQTVALTATATQDVQRDIIEQLDMPDADIRVSGFERPNLFFEVCHARRDADKIKRLGQLIDHWDGESVVVYCATRKQVRQVQKKLAANKVDAAAYHGGMGDAGRARAQNAWMAGDTPVLVATNAFGMGVDKPDVRAVVHFNIPGSVEAYYQEAGRAGRDGDKAHCLLLFNYADKGIHDFFTENSYPLRSEVVRVWQHLRQLGRGAHQVNADRISDELGRQGNKLHSFGVESSLRLLQGAGHIQVLPGGQGIEVVEDRPAGQLDVDWQAVDHRRSVADDQLANILQYATAGGCLQAELLAYFNSEPSFGDACGHCSGCEGVADYVDVGDNTPDKRVAVDDEPAVLVAKVLAGIARARGKRGAHVVAAMLRGSTAKKVRQAGFDRLSTHGLLSGLTQDDLVFLVDLMTSHGLVSRNEYGCVSLTSRGSEVMRSQQPLPEALGTQLDAVVVEPGQRTKRRSRGDAASATGSTYDTTLSMLGDGLDAAQIADKRGLKERTITDHFLKLAARGDTFELGDQLDGDLLARMRTAAQQWQPGDALRPLKDDMPSHCSYDRLKVHLAQVLMERT